MPTAIPRDMTADEFLIWNLSQDQRYELVDGVPVPLRAMAGASNYHDDIVTNLIAALRTKKRGAGCKPRTADTALRTAIKRVRRPDVTVDCDDSRPDSYEAAKPTAVFEVLSPSTRKIDGGVKLNHESFTIVAQMAAPYADVVARSQEKKLHEAPGAGFVPTTSGIAPAHSLFNASAPCLTFT